MKLSSGGFKQNPQPQLKENFWDGGVKEFLPPPPHPTPPPPPKRVQCIKRLQVGSGTIIKVAKDV